MNRLSIFNFDTWPRNFKLPVTILWIVGLLFVFNLILHFCPWEKALPSAYFPRYDASKKHKLLNVQIKKGNQPNLVFLGSSIANMGFNSAVIESSFKKNSPKKNLFNFGLNGAGPSVFLELVAHLILPTTPLKTIVYGICPVELNSGSLLFKKDQLKILDSLYFSLASQLPSSLIPLWTILFNHLDLLRLREVFWTSVYTRESPWFDHSSALTADEYGWTALDKLPWSTKEGKKERLQNENDRMKQLLSSYDLKGYNLEALTALIRYSKEKKIRFLLVNMPTLLETKQIENTAFEGLLPRYSNYQDDLQNLSRSLAIDYLNIGPDPRFLPPDFVDPLHLTPEGTKKLAPILAKFIESGD